MTNVSIRAIPKIRTTAILFCVALILFVLSLDFGTTGDSIYYANIIDTRQFGELSLHQGYYVLGLIFSIALGALLGWSTDQSLVAMSAVFAAGCLAVAYRLLRRYLASDQDALIGCVILACSYRFFSNATSAEIYIVQSFFLWAGFLFFERRSFAFAGFAVFAALWITPLTAFFLLWFPWIARQKGYQFRDFATTVLAAAGLYAVFLLFNYQNLFWGARGLLKIDEQMEGSILNAVVYFVKYQFKSYGFINFLLIPVIWRLRTHQLALWTTLVVGLPNLYVLSNLSYEDNVFILGLDVFFVYWYMVGWQALRQMQLEWLGFGALFTQVLLLFYPVQMAFAIKNETYPAEFRKVSEIVMQHDRPLLFIDWVPRAALLYYNKSGSSGELEEGRLFDSTVDTQKLEDFSVAELGKYDAIYVLEGWFSSPRAKAFLTDAKLEAVQDERSDRRRVERLLGAQCREVLTGPLLLYRCR